eukprot:TRINITY_DN9941_c0_g1_i1.p1 TRINITY_DN9941_c0_g1~~TRINITY_DN9941_c0_g1_i1.p1  ORF type:complete len:970 (+),score=160.23 TRINITY_DN9941_c0_g1_i1:35-2944(+)
MQALKGTRKRISRSLSESKPERKSTTRTKSNPSSPLKQSKEKRGVRFSPLDETLNVSNVEEFADWLSNPTTPSKPRSGRSKMLDLDSEMGDMFIFETAIPEDPENQEESDEHHSTISLPCPSVSVPVVPPGEMKPVPPVFSVTPDQSEHDEKDKEIAQRRTRVPRRVSISKAKKRYSARPTDLFIADGSKPKKKYRDIVMEEDGDGLKKSEEVEMKGDSKETVTSKETATDSSVYASVSDEDDGSKPSTPQKMMSSDDELSSSKKKFKTPLAVRTSTLRMTSSHSVSNPQVTTLSFDDSINELQVFTLCTVSHFFKLIRLSDSFTPRLFKLANSRGGKPLPFTTALSAPSVLTTRSTVVSDQARDPQKVSPEVLPGSKPTIAITSSGSPRDSPLGSPKGDVSSSLSMISSATETHVSLINSSIRNMLSVINKVALSLREQFDPTSPMVTGILKKTMEGITEIDSSPFILHPSLTIGGRRLLQVRSKILYFLYYKTTCVQDSVMVLSASLKEITTATDEGVIYFCGLARALTEDIQLLKKNLSTLLQIESMFLDGKIIHAKPVTLPAAPRQIESTKQKGDPMSIVEALTFLTPKGQHLEEDFVNMFLHTCEGYCKGVVLMKRLLPMFTATDSTGNLQKNILEFLVDWMNTCFYLRSIEVDDMIQDFIDEQQQQCTPDLWPLFESLTAALDDSVEPYRLSSDLALEVTADPVVAESQLWKIVLNHDPRIIAEQLTIQDQNLYRCVEFSELLVQSWSNEKRKVTAQNAIEMVERANSVSYWTALCIILPTRVKERSRMLTRFIQIAVALRQLGNFNALMGIIAGLNLGCVSRLKYTFGNVPPSWGRALDLLDEELSPIGSFRTLRELIENSGSKVIPFLGLHLSDLTFTDEGNPDTIKVEETGEELINFQKYQIVHRCIEGFTKYQTSEAFDNLTPIKVYQMMSQLPKLSKDDLYNLSLDREPKGANPKDIA